MTNFEMPNFYLALPEIVVLSMATITILAHLFLSPRFKDIAYHLVQLTLIIALGISVMQLGGDREVIFSMLYVKDDMASLLKIFIYNFLIYTF